MGDKQGNTFNPMITLKELTSQMKILSEELQDVISVLEGSFYIDTKSVTLTGRSRDAAYESVRESLKNQKSNLQSEIAKLAEQIKTYP